jgi:hypothetical protein
MTQPDNQCPECGGDGWVDAPCTGDGNCPLCKGEDGEIPCPACHGSGRKGEEDGKRD